MDDTEWIKKSLGSFGPFQKRIIALFFFTTFIKAPFSIFSTFVVGIPDHRCKVPECDNETTKYEENFLHFTTPYNEEEERWSQCQSFSVQNAIPRLSTCSKNYFNKSSSTSCSKWVYSDELFKTTAVTEYNLVCDRSWMIPLSTSAYMLGMSCSVVMGYVCDRWGRKIGLILSVLILGGGGLASAFAPNHSIFIILRFITGFGSNSLMLAVYTIAIEFIGKEWRAFCGSVMNIPFSVGEALLGVLAYFVRDFRNLQIICSLPIFILLSYGWLMPESVRWLLTKGKKNEAFKIAEKATKINGLNPPSIPNINSLSSSENIEKGASVFHILKLPNMRKRTLILCYGWAVCTLVYYGISMNSSNLSGNLHINFILTMLAEIPGFFAAFLTLNRLGRKLTMCSVYFLCGIACIISGFIPTDMNSAIILTTMIGKFGISAAFGSIFVYTAEIYPTEYRSVGLGACNVCARLGGVIAPFIANLTNYYDKLPVLIFGGLSSFAGMLFILLPETTKVELPQTLVECEQFARNESIWKCLRARKK